MSRFCWQIICSVKIRENAFFTKWSDVGENSKVSYTIYIFIIINHLLNYLSLKALAFWEDSFLSQLSVYLNTASDYSALICDHLSKNNPFLTKYIENSPPLLCTPCFFAVLIISTVILVGQQSTMWHWTSGTLVKIERTLEWKTWSIDYEQKLWSLKVCSRFFFTSALCHFYPGRKWIHFLCCCVSCMSWLNCSAGPGQLAESYRELQMGYWFLAGSVLLVILSHESKSFLP